MALSDAYATAAEYRAIISMTDSGQDAEILTDLKAISRYIEGKLEQFFNKDTSDATRLFTPVWNDGKLELRDETGLAPLSASPTSVKIAASDGTFTGQTALVSTDYELHPLNAAVQPEPLPYTHVALTAWGTTRYWTAGRRVQIVGRFGWPSVPEGIKSATIQLTAILRLETPRATRRISELDGTMEASSEAQNIVKALMDQYKNQYGFV